MKSARLKSWTAIVAILIAITPAYAAPSFLDNILSAMDSPPEITTAYLDKTKYQLGDQMLITAAVSDDWGLKKVQAQVENENGYETVNLILITGNKREGTWQGAWKVHDTIGIKEYTTKITATDLSGQTAEKILLWIDPVQSHPSDQIRPGTFQSGSYKFPDNVGIGADAAASDKLKVVKTSTGGNAINAKCTGASCDAVYATSSTGYAGYFTGGLGVKIADGLTVSSGKVGIGTTTPQAKLHISEDIDAWPNQLLVDKNSNNVVDGTPRLGMVDTYLGSVTTAPAWYIDNFKDRFRIFRQPNINTAGNEFLTILNTGHVGIGTKSPQGKLEVSGGWLETSNGGDTVRSAISASNGNYLSIEAFNIDNSAKLPVNLNPWGGSVGIGTTSPIGNIGLHLKASKWDYTTAGGMVIQAADSGVDPGIMFFNADGKERGAIGQALAGGRWSQDAMAGDVVLRSAQGRLIFSTDNVNFPPYTPSPSYPARMVIDNNGNVGIGTASPGAKLDVNGNIKWGTSRGLLINDQGASIELGGSGTPYIDFSNDGTTDFDMRLRLTGDDSLAIEGGNVGISGDLDVDGGITLGGVKKTSWPGGGGAASPGESVMYLRENERHGSIASCPSGWSTASTGAISGPDSGNKYILERACYRTDAACQVMYLRENERHGSIASCPSGWSTASTGAISGPDSGNKYILERACYLCH